MKFNIQITNSRLKSQWFFPFSLGFVDISMFFENGNFSHPNLQPTPQFVANSFLPETCPPYFDDSSLQESPPSTSLPPEDRGTEFFAWPKAGDLHEKTRPEFDDVWQKNSWRSWYQSCSTKLLPKFWAKDQKKSKITVTTWWSWNFPTSTPLQPWRPAQLANLLLLWEKTAALHHRQKLFHRKVTTSNPPKNRCILGLFWLKSLQCWQWWTLGCMKHFDNWWAMAMNDWFDLVFCQIHGSWGFFGGKSPLIFVTRADDCLRAPFSLEKRLGWQQPTQ